MILVVHFNKPIFDNFSANKTETIHLTKGDSRRHAIGQMTKKHINESNTIYNRDISNIVTVFAQIISIKILQNKNTLLNIENHEVLGLLSINNLQKY